MGSQTSCGSLVWLQMVPHQEFLKECTHTHTHLHKKGVGLTARLTARLDRGPRVICSGGTEDIGGLAQRCGARDLEWPWFHLATEDEGQLMGLLSHSAQGVSGAVLCSCTFELTDTSTCPKSHVCSHRKEQEIP